MQTNDAAIFGNLNASGNGGDIEVQQFTGTLNQLQMILMVLTNTNFGTVSDQMDQRNCNK